MKDRKPWKASIFSSRLPNVAMIRGLRSRPQKGFDLCAPCGGGEGWRQRRNAGRSPPLHTGMLMRGLGVSMLGPQSTTLGRLPALTLLARVTVHVCLQRTGPGEPLVADLALVLLLGAARNLGRERAHHGLRRGRMGRHEPLWPWQRSRGD